MRQALAIARREVEEKRFVLAMAAACAVMPFLATLLPTARVHDSRSVIAMLAGLFAVAIGPGLALVIGATMVGSDLSSGRLSFYLSKPIATSSVWYGKLAGSIGLVFASVAVILVPAYLASGSAWTGVWVSRWGLIGGLAVVAPALLLISHTVSVMFRARSAVLLVDTIAFSAAIAAGWLIAKPLGDAFAVKLLFAVARGVAAAIFVALLIAGQWQLSRARADRRANHAELSKFVWLSMATILTLAGSFVGWVVLARPGDVRQAMIYPAPRGNWALVQGVLPHRLDYNAAFFLDASTGQFFRVPSRGVSQTAIAFSRDGHHAAWFHGVLGGLRGEIWTRQLDPLSPTRKTGIETSFMVRTVMSDDGARLAYVDHGILNIADANGRSLGSARVDNTSSRWAASDLSLYFFTPDIVRLIVNTNAGGADEKARLITVTLSEFDLRSHQLLQTGEFTVNGRHVFMQATPDGAQLLVRTFGAVDSRDSFFTVDARTGSRIATYPLQVRGQEAFMDDGSLICIGRVGDHWALYRLKSDGQVLNEIALRRSEFPRISGTATDRVIVAVDEPAHGVALGDGWSTLVLNVSRNAVERTIRGVRAASRVPELEADPRLITHTGSIFTAVDAQGRIVRLDINTGNMTPLPR